MNGYDTCALHRYNIARSLDQSHRLLYQSHKLQSCHSRFTSSHDLHFLLAAASFYRYLPIRSANVRLPFV
uniref:Uncharacterized protein n=1 Tax=Anguilla anguilla TaxID=7936 RepID=A0A0E9S2W2_ANGAN